MLPTSFIGEDKNNGFLISVARMFFLRFANYQNNTVSLKILLLQWGLSERSDSSFVIKSLKEYV